MLAWQTDTRAHSCDKAYSAYNSRINGSAATIDSLVRSQQEKNLCTEITTITHVISHKQAYQNLLVALKYTKTTLFSQSTTNKQVKFQPIFR